MQNVNAIIKKPIVSMVYDRKGELKKGATDAALIVRIYFRGVPIYKGTGYRCKPNEWDKKKCEVSAKCDKQAANRFFYELRDKVENIYDESIKKRKELTVPKLKELLQVVDSSSFTEFMQNEVNRKESATASVKAYLTTIKTFIEYKKDVTFDDVDVRFLENYRKYLAKRNLSPNTQNKHFRHLRMFWNEAIKYDYTKDYPFKQFKLKDETSERDHLTIDEFKTLISTDISSLKNIDNGKNTARNALDMYIFSCITGLRISDVLQISPKQVRKVKNELVIDFRQQKTGDKLVTPFETLCDKICPQFKQTLIDYLDFANENKQKTLFPYTCQANVNRIIKRVAALAGIEKNLSFHTSRHTCAMLLLNEGGQDITTVSKVLGHKSIKTTQVYAKMRDETVTNLLKEMKSIW